MQAHKFKAMNILAIKQIKAESLHKQFEIILLSRTILVALFVKSIQMQSSVTGI